MHWFYKHFSVHEFHGGGKSRRCTVCRLEIQEESRIPSERTSKWLGSKSRIPQMDNLSLRYGWSKEIRDYMLEDGSLSNLRSAGHLDLEENASHHFLKIVPGCQGFPLRCGNGVDTIVTSVENNGNPCRESLEALPLVEGEGCEALSSRSYRCHHVSQNTWKSMFLKIDKEHPRASRITPKHS